MGFWGPALFSNDITGDVKDTYLELLKNQATDDEAYNKTFAEYEELFGTDEEMLFWYALADTQWNVGRLSYHVKETALKLIAEKAVPEEAREDEVFYVKYQNTLKKLEEKLNSPQKARKRFPKKIEYVTNPWNVGDVYAYQFNQKESVEKGLYGKYILMQKIGNFKFYQYGTHSVVQVFDGVFDELPDLNVINEMRILPMVYPPGKFPLENCPKSFDEFVSPFETSLKMGIVYSRIREYPKKNLFFIGNSPVEGKEYFLDEIEDALWSCVERLLSIYYFAWRGEEY